MNPVREPRRLPPPRPRRIPGAVACLILAALLGPPRFGPGVAPARPSRPAGIAGKVKFKDDAGAEVFSIKPEPDGAKVVDPRGAEIARYKLDGDALKIKGPGEQVLGFVAGTPGSYRLTDAGRKAVLFALRRQEDGDWKLEDGRGTLLNKIKVRDYGFEVEDARKASLGKVKVKDGKTSLRDATDKVRFSTKDPIPPLAVSCLGLDAVGGLPLRAGLLVRVALTEGR